MPECPQLGGDNNAQQGISTEMAGFRNFQTIYKVFDFQDE